MMNELLEQLGFNQKESKVYLALLEFGTQPASVIARKTALPKASILFLLEGMLKLGYVRKTKRGRTQFFHADPEFLSRAKEKEMTTQKKALEKAIPLLQEFKSPFSSQPKVTFFEGLENCKKAYLMLLESKTEIIEFGAHGDLLKFGEDFMRDFIKERVRRKIFLRAIGAEGKIERNLKKLDKKQRRHITIAPLKFGHIYSSIAIFDNKTLLLNLYHDAFAILIENPEVAETLKTIFRFTLRS